MPKLISLTISGELLTALIDKVYQLPKDAVILKIIPEQRANYAFEILVASKEGIEVQECEVPYRDKRLMSGNVKMGN